MSRIGNRKLTLPTGVTASLEDNILTVKGAKGSLTQEVHKLVSVEICDTEVITKAKNSSKEANINVGTMNSLIANMIEGVTNGFSKSLIINGVGYKVFEKPNGIELKIGYSHPVIFDAPEGIKITCPSQQDIKVTGYDKQKVGQIAANIRAIQPVEPYHAYGIRYADEVVIRKEGKTAAKK